MENKFKDKFYFDEQLKQVDKDIIWEEKGKRQLENKILFTMDSNRYKNKTKLFAGFKYAFNIGIMGILLLFGYYFLSNSITQQSGESSTGNEGNQTNNNPIIDDDKDHEEMEKKAPENDENQVGSEDVEEKETNLEIHTGSSDTVIRNVEGENLEVKVINYDIQPYGIAYQLDEGFGVPEVSGNKITYSYFYSTQFDHEITLEMLEHTNIEKAVSNLQERFETEGFEESSQEGYRLESTPVEENGLIGKVQLYGDHPMKGFIAYEIGEHALVITFQYSIVAADAMNPLLENLRESIKAQ